MNGKANKNVLVWVDASWGEIEWILPVCKYIKDNLKDLNVIMIFNSFEKEDIIRSNFQLGRLIEESVHVQYTLGEFLWPFAQLLFCAFGSLIKNLGCFGVLGRKIRSFLYRRLKSHVSVAKIFSTVDPQIFLRDTGDMPKRSLLGEIVPRLRKRNIPIVMYPHGTDLNLDWGESGPESYEGDLLLCNNDNDKRIWGRIFTGKFKMVVGSPKYDKWWIDFIRSKCSSGSVKGDKINVMFITRGPHHVSLSPGSFEYLMREGIKEILSFPNTYLYVRPHPRCPIRLLKKFLDKYDPSRWEINTENLYCLADNLDFVVSMWSSMTLDSLALNLPVIEFFRFEGSNQQWFRDEKGKQTTGYRKLGLAAEANTGEELKQRLTEFMDDPSDIRNKYVEAFKKHVVLFENASEKASGEILKLMNVNGGAH